MVFFLTQKEKNGETLSDGRNNSLNFQINSKFVTCMLFAGRLGSNTKQSGDIRINGRKQALAFGTSVSQSQSMVYHT